MKSPALLIDVSCLAYRSLYSVGDLSFEGVATGALFGMFRTVMDCQDAFAADRVAWCFDRGYGKRLALSRSYKGNRKARDKTQEEMDALRSLRNQLYKLRTEYLPEAGFANVFWQDDYEADDVIASVCENLDVGDRVVIVGTDQDLWQLLVDDRVEMWNLTSKQLQTASWFRSEWGLTPAMWADVKAIAGCPGDNVIGVAGVGEKTAAKFLTGELKEKTKAYQAIVSSNDVWRRNLLLTRIPFSGAHRFRLGSESVGLVDWGRLAERLGMKSLLLRGGRHGRKMP